MIFFLLSYLIPLLLIFISCFNFEDVFDVVFKLTKGGLQPTLNLEIQNKDFNFPRHVESLSRASPLSFRRSAHTFRSVPASFSPFHP